MKKLASTLQPTSEIYVIYCNGMVQRGNIIMAKISLGIVFFDYVRCKVSNGHSPQIRRNGELLVRMCRGESQKVSKSPLANVSECIESGESGWRMSGECIESGESGWQMSGECINPTKTGWQLLAQGR
jgi:hypothetical protein